LSGDAGFSAPFEIVKDEQAYSYGFTLNGIKHGWRYHRPNNYHNLITPIYIGVIKL